MSFTMIHLCVADKVSKTITGIEDLPQFILGSIAPDAVHNRQNYNSTFKKASHLIDSDEQWGMITKYEQWKESTLAFLNKHRQSEHRDFILGYCCHILTDVYNTETVYSPYRLKHLDDAAKGYGGQYHQESQKIDIELALTVENRHAIWQYLERSRGVDLDDIITAEEIEAQKGHILNKWYKDKGHPDISANEIVTYGGSIDFIENAAEYVLTFLK